MRGSRCFAGMLSLGILAGGCLANEKSLVIVFNVAPDDNCKREVQEDDSATAITAGVLDLTTPPLDPGGVMAYWMFPQVHNYMPTNLNPPQSQLDAMTVVVTGASLTYEWLERGETTASAALLGLESLTEQHTYRATTVGSADPSGEPGKAVVRMNLLSPTVSSTLRANVDAQTVQEVVLGVHLRVVGRTLGGTAISSNDFLYPIYLCLGCLTNLMCCADDSDPLNDYPAKFCIAGQDGPLPCQC